MKYIDADLLIRKIRGQIRLENLNFAALGGGGQTFCINTLEWVLKQIDSLQQEQQKVDLEKEIEEYWIATEWSKAITLGKFKVIARYFYGLGQLNSK